MSQVRIFISHSHQDNEWCRPFADALKAVGYDVWYDETGLTGGAAWVATIQHEVQTRDVFLIVLTPEAWASPWVQDELQLAIATRRRILPVLLRNTQVDGFLLTTQWVTVIGEQPQAAARSVIVAVEAPPAPGRNAAQQAPTETLDELVTLCRSLIAEQRYTEALSVCGRGLAIDPDSVEMLRLKGRVLLQVNEPFKAAEMWAQALSLAESEQVTKLAQEVFEWYEFRYSPRVYVRYIYPFIEYLNAVLSHITSGTALLDVTDTFLCLGGVNDETPQYTPSTTHDTNVLRAALSTAKRRYSETLAERTPGWRRYALDVNLKLGWLVAVEYLTESCFGYPPDKATPADVDELKFYRGVLEVLGDRQNSCEVVSEYIQRLSNHS